MEDNHTIATELATAFTELEKSVQRFNPTQFNTKPADKSWSAAMVVQHLILAGKGIDQVLLGNTKPTVGAADQKVETIRNILLDFNAKYNSPPFIEPKDQHYEQEEQLQQLQQIVDAILPILPNLDLSETCLEFEFPGLGQVTRLELISFLIFHTQRHTHQLHHMFNAVATSV